MGPRNFMTVKEKNYVAECFRRNMRYFRSAIDYSVLFGSDPARRIEVEAGGDEPRRTANPVFGRENKKSGRRVKQSLGSGLDEISPSLRTMVLVESLIGMYTIRKHCRLTDDELHKNVESFRSLLLTNFNKFVSVAKFFGFLGDYLSCASEDEGRELIVLLQRSFHLISNTSEFYGFINSAINSIPMVSRDELEPGFMSTFLFFSSGIVLATSLLVQNEDLSTVFYEAFIDEPSLSFMNSRYIWQFLSVLVSLVDYEKQKLVIRKVRPCLLETARKADKEGLGQIKLFLDTIGLGLEDIKE